MIKKISLILFAVIMVIMLISCKNPKQKLQEYVVAYNKTAPSFKAENVTLTTARGYINDNKIELRFETNLEQSKPNVLASKITFPRLLKEMLNKDQIPKDLINEGIQFDVYFLANDNTVLDKEVIDTNSMKDLLK